MTHEASKMTTIQFPNRQWAFNYSWHEAQQGKNVKISRVNGIWEVTTKVLENVK